MFLWPKFWKKLSSKEEFRGDERRERILTDIQCTKIENEWNYFTGWSGIDWKPRRDALNRVGLVRWTALICYESVSMSSESASNGLLCVYNFWSLFWAQESLVWISSVSSLYPEGDAGEKHLNSERYNVVWWRHVLIYAFCIYYLTISKQAGGHESWKRGRKDAHVWGVLRFVCRKAWR